MNSLEQKFYDVIREDKDDPDTLLAYSKYLQEQGDPRGEIIALELALKSGKSNNRDALSARLGQLNIENEKYLGLPEEILEAVDVGWTYGFVTYIWVVYKIENWMDELGKILVRSCVKSLSNLQLGQLGLYKFPEWIEEFNQLTILGFEANHLTEIPGSIENLQQLTLLDLGVDKITEIPHFVENLKELTELHLQRNRIKVIPKSLKNRHKSYKLI